jgi:endo-1,4-beta-xylanase
MRSARLSLIMGVLLVAGACAPAYHDSGAVAGQPSLAQLFGEHFRVGAALNDDQVSGRDSVGEAIARHHFNTVTPENVLKWEKVQPEPGRYDFAAADRVVQFAEKAGLFIVGHTLVWHSQTPAWVFEDGEGGPATREQLLERMRDHIFTVVGRYAGRVHAWDVVNEALNEDGSLRDSPWRQIIGDDYLLHAFRWAHEADPSAELYYNDYSLEDAPKRQGAVRLARWLLEQGAPIHGIGTQLHVRIDWPTVAEVDSTLTALAATGLQVMVTELDIDVLPAAWHLRTADVAMRAEMADSLNPYPTGLPEQVQRELADRYADLFRVFLNHRDSLSRVTFWGVYDARSWLNTWPIAGRTNYPLLFDRQGKAKPAFDAVVRVGRE